tara:strand:- start:140 stop:628 length:489 start_codon:yes stop_codon:yes gene_type:complete
MNATDIVELGNATAQELNTTAIASATTTIMEDAAGDCGGGTYFPQTAHGNCPPTGLDIEERFLAVLGIALACAVCALCVLVVLLTALVHKLSTLWVKALVRPAANSEPSDDPRKGLLHETKSCLRNASESDSNDDGKKKKKKTSFTEDTSCAAPRDVDEEDL